MADKELSKEEARKKYEHVRIGMKCTPIKTDYTYYSCGYVEEMERQLNSKYLLEKVNKCNHKGCLIVRVGGFWWDARDVVFTYPDHEIEIMKEAEKYNKKKFKFDVSELTV